MIDSRVSVLIPSRNEQFLQKTIDGVFKKAKGDIEVVVYLDGYWTDPVLKHDPRLVVVHKSKVCGMRSGINSAAAVAKGEYLLKLDGHCLLDEGFDMKLKADCEDDWVVVPTRKRLDAENWCIQETKKPDINYMYLSYPDDPKDWGGPGLHGRLWREKNINPELKKVLIDETMSFQGSCWFLKRDYFYYLELMDEENYGPFWKEAQEIGLKAFLSGGRVMRNKNTWYAHLHKGKRYGRGYHLPKYITINATSYVNEWLNKKVWHKQKHDFAWLIDKFSPVPTWKPNWKEDEIWKTL